MSFRELLFRERQVFGFGLLPFLPVLFELWVIWRGSSFDKDMPHYREPVELEQVPPGLFVSKRPGVQSIQIEWSPVVLPPPFAGFLGMHPFGVAERLLNHPVIQFPKEFFCHSAAEVDSPSTNDGVQLS